MKVLVVGGGGREHALITALKKNPTITQFYCAPGNAGIQAAGVECVDIKATDVSGMLRFAWENQVDFAVIAQDDPLALGMVDVFEEHGIATFGPTGNAAQIESSKVFSKNLMKKYKIPTADYEVFSDPEKAIAYIRMEDKFPVVIKADGLALGKGVVIAQSLQEAETAVRSMMEDKVFGESGSRIVVEEFLTGPEVSVLAFCDGETVSPMISSMDHKRVYDDNKGPNTGGMGAVAPNFHYSPQIAARCKDEIFEPTIKAMQAEGCPFSGCLYFGLMLTPDGPKVIEYNCRFGDPEAQVVLPLLETDLFEIMQAIHQKRLKDLEIEWNPGASACVVAASGGYPAKYETGLPIRGLDDETGQLSGKVMVYHAGTKQQNNAFVTAGGRVLGVTAVGETLPEALQKAYAAMEKIGFAGMHYRKDIGSY